MVCLALAAIFVVAAVAEAIVVLTPAAAESPGNCKGRGSDSVYSPVFADAVKVVFGNLARTCTTPGERAKRDTWNLHGGTKRRR